MKVDHARAIRDARYAAKKRAKIAAASASRRLVEVVAIHDHNRACCRRQPWKATLGRLIASTIATETHRGPDDIAALIAEHEPDVIFAAGRPGGRR